MTPAPAPQGPSHDRSLRVIVSQGPGGFEKSLRDFHRHVQDEGVIREIKRRAFFIPAAEARRLKSIEARKRSRQHSSKGPDKRAAKA